MIARIIVTVTAIATPPWSAAGPLGTAAPPPAPPALFEHGSNYHQVLTEHNVRLLLLGLQVKG